MVKFQVEPGEKRRLWPFLLIGAVVVVAVVLLFGWVGGHPSGPMPKKAKPLPFGATEQAYAGKIKFENLKMSRFANMFNQEVTYVDGDMVNQGDRPVAGIQVMVVFRDIDNNVVLRQTMHPLSRRDAPLAPGERRPFRMAFERIPDSWNMQHPGIQINGLVLR